MPKANPIEMVKVKVTKAFKDENDQDVSVGEHEFPKVKFEEWKKNGIVKEGVEIIPTPVPNVTIHPPEPALSKKEKEENERRAPGLSAELSVAHTFQNPPQVSSHHAPAPTLDHNQRTEEDRKVAQQAKIDQRAEVKKK